MLGRRNWINRAARAVASWTRRGIPMSRSRSIVRLVALAAGVSAVASVPSAARAQVLVWQSFQDAGKKAIERGCLDEAARLYQAALQEVTQPGVFEPRKVATSTSDLGYVYTLQRHYPEAESLTQWALSERERLLGPIHREVAESLVRLGRIYIGQGRFPEAEPPIRRAIPILTKANKTFEHPDVAEALELLAESLRSQVKLSEALALQEKALLIRERVLSNRELTLSEGDPGLTLLREQLASSLEKTAALLRKAPCAAPRAEQIQKEADALDERAKDLRNLVTPPGPAPSPEAKPPTALLDPLQREPG
jgi:tetratricopeptide (TPR) repeat protein